MVFQFELLLRARYPFVILGDVLPSLHRRYHWIFCLRSIEPINYGKIFILNKRFKLETIKCTLFEIKVIVWTNEQQTLISNSNTKSRLNLHKFIFHTSNNKRSHRINKMELTNFRYVKPKQNKTESTFQLIERHLRFMAKSECHFATEMWLSHWVYAFQTFKNQHFQIWLKSTLLTNSSSKIQYRISVSGSVHWTYKQSFYTLPNEILFKSKCNHLTGERLIESFSSLKLDLELKIEMIFPGATGASSWIFESIQLVSSRSDLSLFPSLCWNYPIQFAACVTSNNSLNTSTGRIVALNSGLYCSFKKKY